MDIKSNTARVFLSYGRKDAYELAKRLFDELTKRNFEVWIDLEKIRGGKEWEAQIIDGLRKTNVVIALLSPHSTRRTESADDDSVCLDEIAWARYEPPTTPIVPVLAVKGAHIPLTVYRLHYLDLVDTLNSDEIFQQKVDELEATLCDVLAGSIKYRGWESWLSSNVEFDRFLYAKHRNFTGRKWLFQEIESWLTNVKETSLLLTGDPGIGKSAIMAELAYGRLNGVAIATYCCQWDVPETLRPVTFIRSLRGALSS